MSEILKITNRDLIKLDQALKCLDCSRAGKDEVIPFEFDARVSWSLAKNSVLVERAKLAFDRAIRQQSKQCGLTPGDSIRVGPGDNPDPELVRKFAAFEETADVLKDQETEISGLIFISLKDLLTKPSNSDGKQGKNPIPQSVIIGLVPIIKGDAP